MIGRSLRRALVLLGAFSQAVSGCADNPSEPLPFGFTLPTGTPYIEGQIIHREIDAHGDLRILVRSGQGSDARVPEALVTVRRGTTLLWSDHALARESTLKVSRHVTVWPTGPELRSLPPQVQAEVIIVRRLVSPLADRGTGATVCVMRVEAIPVQRMRS